MANNVTSKGQVTIPKKVRDRLGIAAGSAVAFELTDAGEVVLRAIGRGGGRRPARAPKSRFAEAAGSGDGEDADRGDPGAHARSVRSE